jgi:hypothetical protein
MQSGAVPGALFSMASVNGFETCQVHGGLLDSFVACHTFICVASRLIMIMHRDDSRGRCFNDSPAIPDERIPRLLGCPGA